MLLGEKSKLGGLLMSNTPIRVLHVVGCLNMGGAETMIMNLYRVSNRDNMQFDFLVYEKSDGFFDREIEELGGKIILLKRSNKLNVFKYYHDFKSIIRNHGPYQAIHVHTKFHSGLVLLCAKILNIPIRICHAHSTSDRNNDSKIRLLYQIVMRNCILFSATQFLACGKAAAQFLYGKSFANSVCYVTNAIDYDKFNSVEQGLVNQGRREIGAVNSELVIGSIASFREAKNHIFMLDIAEAMKMREIQFKMVFVGGGLLFEDIKMEVEKRHLSNNVIFMGVRDDVHVLMRAFDVVLMPSLYEGLPVTLVETQASNVCAVISNNITDEVDFDLGLIKKVSLNAEIDIWISEIIKGAPLKNTVSQQEILNKLCKNGYIVRNSVDILYKVYSIKSIED